MKSLYILIAFTFGIFSCKRDTALTLSDLKFPEPERAFIRSNGIDTTFFYYPQESGEDIIFYQAYDTSGRVVVDSTTLATVVRYTYDSHGLLVKKETRNGHSVWIDSITYTFDKDSILLKQRWHKSNIEYKFSFDDKGRTLKSVKSVWSENSMVVEQRIHYTYKGDKLQQSIAYLGSGSNPITLENRYYYSSTGILDSVILRASTDNKPQRFFYDSLGLFKEEWHGSHRSDSRVVHKRVR